MSTLIISFFGLIGYAIIGIVLSGMLVPLSNKWWHGLFEDEDMGRAWGFIWPIGLGFFLILSLSTLAYKITNCASAIVANWTYKRFLKD